MRRPTPEIVKHALKAVLHEKRYIDISSDWGDDDPELTETAQLLSKHLDRLLQSQPATLTHGDNSKCPEVVSGEWKFCRGHLIP